MATETGKVLCFFRDKKFGKILSDNSGQPLWFFEADVPCPDDIRTDVRVSFDILAYQQKGQSRVKAVNVRILAPLSVSAPDLHPVRAAKPKPVMPSAEALSKLVNVEQSAKRFVRI